MWLNAFPFPLEVIMFFTAHLVLVILCHCIWHSGTVVPSLRTLAQKHSRSFAPIAVTSKAPENHTVTWASLLCLQWNPRDIGRWDSFKDSDSPAWQEPAWYSAPVRAPFLQHCQSHLKTAPRQMEFKTVYTGGWVWGDSMPWKRMFQCNIHDPSWLPTEEKLRVGMP